MAYTHEPYVYSIDSHPQHALFFQHPAQFQQHPAMMYQHLPFPDYAEYMHLGRLGDEYEDPNEISTRPRLTKEQVEVLESQFQAHPKPNGVVKKQLAMQTKLTLPRVANWFQNRRAKAKQQRKQEEYEIQQTLTSQPSSRPNGARGRNHEATNDLASPSPLRPQSSTIALDSRGPLSEPLARSRSSETNKEASWASLQRALSQAHAAQQQRVHEHQQDSLAMLPPEMPVQRNLDTWSTSSPVAPHDMGFDFRFDHDWNSTNNSTTEETPEELAPHYVLPSDEWSSYLGEARSKPVEYTTAVSPSLPLPGFATSRRGSGAEDLASNLGTFALGNTPPLPEDGLMRTTDGEIDLASRRKRPRPAALTSASLRSRSYGALTPTSPAFRPTPAGGGLRHVKSTGHNLNTHYAGIRKASLPQKSPLNIATFAEADSIKQLMARHATLSQTGPPPPPPPPPPGPAPADLCLPGTSHYADGAGALMQTAAEVLTQYRHISSPPVTPFQNEFLVPNATTGLRQPVAVPAQYATFSDYTPPYSAGPLTNSTCSYSDAPLHSPDLPIFGPNSYVTPISLSGPENPFQQWILASDTLAESPSAPVPAPVDDRKTEFFITEFPGQKEEHASIAQHAVQHRPKNYTFANTAPSDYNP